MSESLASGPRSNGFFACADSKMGRLVIICALACIACLVLTTPRLVPVATSGAAFAPAMSAAAKEASTGGLLEAAHAFCESYVRPRPCPTLNVTRYHPPSVPCPSQQVALFHATKQSSCPSCAPPALLASSAATTTLLTDGWENPDTGLKASAARPLRRATLPNCPDVAAAPQPPAVRQDNLFDLSDATGIIGDVVVTRSWDAGASLRPGAPAAFINVSFTIFTFVEHLEYHDAYAWLHSPTVITVGEIAATAPAFMAHLKIVNATTRAFLSVKLELSDAEDYSLHLLCRLLVKGRMFLYRVGEPLPVRVRASAGDPPAARLPAVACDGWTRRRGRWLACAATAAWTGGCLRDGWVFVPFDCHYHVSRESRISVRTGGQSRRPLACAPVSGQRALLWYASPLFVSPTPRRFSTRTRCRRSRSGLCGRVARCSAGTTWH